MGAKNIRIDEQVPASRKLGLDAARDLLANADELIVAKGRKVTRLKLADCHDDEAATAMLGPTGNLRAPTLKVGSTLIVGFDEESYERVLA